MLRPETKKAPSLSRPPKNSPENTHRDVSL